MTQVEVRKIDDLGLLKVAKSFCLIGERRGLEMAL